MLRPAANLQNRVPARGARRLTSVSFVSIEVAKTQLTHSPPAATRAETLASGLLTAVEFCSFHPLAVELENISRESICPSLKTGGCLTGCHDASDLGLQLQRSVALRLGFRVEVRSGFGLGMSAAPCVISPSTTAQCHLISCC